MSFAVDALHRGSERLWQPNAITGCVYVESGEVYVRYGKAIAWPAFFGEVESAPAPGQSAARRTTSMARRLAEADARKNEGRIDEKPSSWIALALQVNARARTQPSLTPRSQAFAASARASASRPERWCSGVPARSMCAGPSSGWRER